MPPFKLEVEKRSGSTDALAVYQLNGKLSLETVNAFVQKLRPEPAQHLILDMSGVTFFDSADRSAGVAICEPP